MSEKPPGNPDSKDRFEQEIRGPAIARFPERPGLVRSTSEPVAPIHTSDDLPDFGDAIGFPGEYPYTRGIHASMYRSRLWTMRQYAGFGSAQESNARYRFLLEQGQTGLSVAFDLPTQMGLDSDNPKSLGEVGKVGVAIDSIEDMGVLLQGIPLDQVSTSMTINATASILLTMYMAVAEQQGIAAKDLRGTIQNDLLKEYIARGTYIYPPDPSLRIICDIFEFCGENLPQWNTISISGYHIREAGSDAAQEIAFTLANGIAYVDAAVQRGLDVDSFAPRLAFFFNVHNNFLEEIAKFRAARQMWAQIMRERFGARNPRSMMLRFHTQTGGSTLTAQQPYVNVARVSLQAMAAVLGGTQSLHTNSFDEALGLPTEAAALLALRTQQVIANESGVDAFVDPLGGSYAIETITSQLVETASGYIERIDKMGGMVEAIKAGFPQREILETAYRSQKAMERGEDIVVGVNKYTADEEISPSILKIDPTLEQSQRQRIEDVRRRRDSKDALRKLAELKRAAASDANVVGFILECVRAQCTLGEISEAMEEIFGHHTETLVV